ncbi:MAG TPA: BON domain-containing protein [Labilithrix sp.]|jgi:osmotically-inducible protein OsmY
MANPRAYGDPEGEDVPVRDRPYESFGEQGYAMPDHVAGSERERGAARVELGRPVVATDDDRLLDTILRVLSEAESLDAHAVDVFVEAREVTLNGMVADEDQRARIEAIVESVEGVAGIVNNVLVDRR